MMKVIRILMASLILLATTPLMLIAMEVGQEPAATDEVLYKCDFDTGLCGMTIEASPRTQFSWVRLSGPTPSDITGPDFDHTTNSMKGYYMYTEATDHYPGEITKLTIPSASISAPQTGSVLDACLTFWYNMYGYHIGDLNITVGSGEAIWSLSRNQSIGWKPMNVTLRHFLDTNPSTTGKGSITFLGTRGGNDIGEPFGDIAIDDVIIYAGRCGEEETTTVEPTTTPTTTTTSTTTTPSMTTTTSTTTTPSTTTTTTTPTTTTTTPATTTTTTTTPGTTTSTIASTTTSTTMSITSTNPPTPTPSTTTTISPTTTTQSTLMSSSPSVPSTTTTISTTTTTTLPSTTHSSTTRQTSANSAMSTQTSAHTSTQTSDVTTTADRSMTSAVTSGTKPNNLDGSTQKAESQGGTLTENRVWGLSERDMIILVTILCVAILLLIILCIVLICCLCIVRRKYNVERTANLYPSSSTIDRVSTVEANPHGSRGGPGYVSPYDKTPSHHY